MMNKRLTLNIYPLFIALIFFTCNSSSDIKKDIGKKDDNKTKPAVTYNPYFPVAEGNLWEYINEAPREESIIFKVQMLSVSEDGSDRIIDLSSFPFFSGTNDTAKLRIKSNGEVYVLKGTNEELCIPSADNLKNGFTWNYGQWRGSVNFLNDTIKTENGTYTNCILLDYSISITFSAEIWLAKNKGIIKWGYNRTNPPTLKPIYYVLKELTLSK